jgi:L-amino acid N-acyltransferase YncA
MPADVPQPDRSVVEQGAQHAVHARQLADPGGARLGDPDGQEPGEAAPAVGDAQRAVAGADRRSRGAQHALQDPVQVEVLVDGQQLQRAAVHVRSMVRAVSLTDRPARPGDAPAIARIYNQGIEDRVATFETDPRSPAQVAATLERRAGTHPVVVVERDAHVLAFAWTGPYSDRPCYRGIGELSVYVERAARGGGLGRLAMDALVRECDLMGYWKLVSRVFTDNAASRRLCVAAGFREVGIHRRHARLDGVWRDVVVVERLLGEATSG